MTKWKKKCLSMTNMDTVSLESTAGNIISKKSFIKSKQTCLQKGKPKIFKEIYIRVSAGLKKSWAYFHPEKYDLNNKSDIGEMLLKMQNLIIPHKEELTQPNNTVQILSKKVQMLETKLNNTVKAPEDSTNESIKRSGTYRKWRPFWIQTKFSFRKVKIGFMNVISVNSLLKERESFRSMFIIGI